MSVIRSYSGSMEGDLDTYRTLMVMGVRLASWNQILDPWVYILLRRAVLRKIYRITTGRSDLRGSTFRRTQLKPQLIGTDGGIPGYEFYHMEETGKREKIGCY
ncbi:hypothetical protein M9458_005379 [Cirrhinus mrigala]|uniref:Uncharacterized protein n=1 Tax=Cirrhinus mrigala TaxID=683832 RepID=A0ABD0REG3_CIRMR